MQAGRAKDDDNSLTEYKSKERIVEILKGTLYLLPCLANEIGISMSFSHKFYAQSGFSLAPVITFSRTLPEDSWVFTTIKGGDLVEFQRLLHTRGALLSDRDTSGRCLLNVGLSLSGVKCRAISVDLTHASTPWKPYSQTSANFWSVRELRWTS